LRFHFTGEAGEYFRIWIVNMLLTIVTLGIYSAWAKVRNKQYFYRHTFVDGTSFEYLADPIRVLKGRLIVAGALALVVGSHYYSLLLYGILVGASVLATPWLVVKALSFNARNSAYRNVRFSFAGRAGEAFGLYLGLGFLHLLTCGLAYPYMQWRLTKFAATEHSFGDRRFYCVTEVGAYYMAYLIAFLSALPIYGLFFGLVISTSMSASRGDRTAMFVAMPLAYLGMLIPAAFLKARLANSLYGGLRIGTDSLTSSQRGRDLCWIYFTNALAVGGTLGLLIPWAKVRLARYRAGSVDLHVTGPIDAIALSGQRDPAAIGDAASDLGDFDFDFSP